MAITEQSDASEKGEGCETISVSKRWKWLWPAMIVAVIFRLILIALGLPQLLSARPEVSSPLTSIHRLAEGQWLKQLSLSPYAGSMYHGSPLLLAVFGPLTVRRTGQPMENIFSCLFLFADVFTATLLLKIGDYLHFSTIQSTRTLKLSKFVKIPKEVCPGDVAALVYLWNPLAMLSCVGASTSSIENLLVVLTLFGACAGITPLAAFGWIMSTHLALYPATLVFPVIFLLGFGLDTPPRKFFKDFKLLGGSHLSNTADTELYQKRGAKVIESVEQQLNFSWKPVLSFVVWSVFWCIYILGLCSISVKHQGGLQEMLKETYGFILLVEDLSPNLGLFWYFFTEIFDFFREFFLLVFHANVLFMILPLTIRLNHRPCFLAFVLLTIVSMLKAYPVVGDAALYFSLIPLFIHELAGMRFSFLLLNGFLGISLLSPAMYNLWIWRGTGNANFYFATALVYACLELILVIESVGTMLSYDRSFRKLLKTSGAQQEKS